VEGGGHIFVPEAPGHGMEPDLPALRKYLVDVEITVGGEVIYKTPTL
jgi:L-alanine-DL-glutamate epimerase-like enolase superfamily enzyme